MACSPSVQLDFTSGESSLMSCIFRSHSQWPGSVASRGVDWLPGNWSQLPGRCPSPAPVKLLNFHFPNSLHAFMCLLSPFGLLNQSVGAEAQIGHLRRLKWVEARANTHGGAASHTHACMGEG